MLPFYIFSLSLSQAKRLSLGESLPLREALTETLPTHSSGGVFYSNTKELCTLPSNELDFPLSLDSMLFLPLEVAVSSIDPKDEELLEGLSLRTISQLRPFTVWNNAKVLYVVHPTLGQSIGTVYTDGIEVHFRASRVDKITKANRHCHAILANCEVLTEESTPIFLFKAKKKSAKAKEKALLAKLSLEF